MNSGVTPSNGLRPFTVNFQFDIYTRSDMHYKSCDLSYEVLDQLSNYQLFNEHSVHRDSDYYSLNI